MTFMPARCDRTVNQFPGACMQYPTSFGICGSRLRLHTTLITLSSSLPLSLSLFLTRTPSVFCAPTRTRTRVLVCPPARHLNYPQKYNGATISRLGSATESPTHEPWDYLAKLPVEIAEPYTARAVQYIMRPLLSSVWKRLQPQIRTGPVTNRFTHFPEARSLPSPEERDRGAAASQKI